MIWIANCLVALAAALHLYFLALEMFLWTKPLGLKTFRNSIEKAYSRRVPLIPAFSERASLVSAPHAGRRGDALALAH
jgi:Protein of unknown function (DUF1304)